MSYTGHEGRPIHARRAGHHGDAGSSGPPNRKRRFRRIAFISLGSVVGLLAVTAIAGYTYVNHMAGSVPRVRVAHLVAARQPAGGPAAGGQTFLITGSQFGPTGVSFQPSSPPAFSNFIALLHVNADGRAGGVISVPADAVIRIPGAGRAPLWTAMRTGGPGLLVQAIEQDTGVPINHYARIDLQHIANLVDVEGGVNVTLPAPATSFGHTFTAGVNHLNGLTAIYYARQPSLTDQGRELRQLSLVRAVLRKTANAHLLTSPVTTVRVLNAITSALTVDSTFTNSDVMSLAKQLGGLSSSAATFVTAPSRVSGGRVLLDPAISAQLWSAVKQDALVAFAAKHPSTVTPQAVP
jgi:LCP family protein required for cell wall assembly